MSDATLDRLRQNVHAPHAMDVPWGWGNCQLSLCRDVATAIDDARQATLAQMRPFFERMADSLDAAGQSALADELRSTWRQAHDAALLTKEGSGS